jgi:hypothetical protein
VNSSSPVGKSPLQEMPARSIPQMPRCVRSRHRRSGLIRSVSRGLCRGGKTNRNSLIPQRDSDLENAQKHPRTPFSTLIEPSNHHEAEVKVAAKRALAPPNSMPLLRLMSTLPSTFVDYQDAPREYRLSSINAVLNVHTRVSDLLSSPYDQVREQPEIRNFVPSRAACIAFPSDAVNGG